MIPPRPLAVKIRQSAPNAVIPGRSAAANPESRNTGPCAWIPGCLATLGPRNDGVLHGAKCLIRTTDGDDQTFGTQIVVPEGRDL